MLSKNKTKLVNSLHKKKGRSSAGLFIAEGEKLVHELLASKLICRSIIATPEWLAQHPIPEQVEQLQADAQELASLSQLSTPSPVMAIFAIPEAKFLLADLANQLVVFLDSIQDPGNLGTIVRICNWFGISTIICNKGTADVYNIKTIQATMGAIADVAIHYVEAPDFFAAYHSLNLPIYGTTMQAQTIYSHALSPNGLIVLGNEGNGLSDEVIPHISQQLSIPAYQKGDSSESLNVAVSAGIICAEFRRRLQ
jgi:TrmH family RNA methyltransferase